MDTTLKETPGSPEQAPEESVKEAVEAIAEEAPAEALEPIAAEAPAEAVAEAIEEAAEEAIEEPTAEAAEEAAEEAAALEATVSELFGDTAAEASDAAAGESSEAAPAEESTPTQDEAPEPEKKRKGKTAKIIVGAILGVLVVGLALGYAYYHNKIALLQYSDGTTAQEGTVEEDDPMVMEQAEMMESAIADLEVIEPVLSNSGLDGVWETPFDSNIINILILGTDERSTTFIDAARSDTIILCSVNLDTGAIKLISIERGMGVPVLEGRYQGEWDWITHIFRYGGADLMMKTVSYVFDLDVHYFIRVNFNTFIQLVDSMGGIDITLSQREADGLNVNIVAYNRDLCDWVQAGENHMNGFLALQYARMRKIDSDWQRVVRQRNTIRAIMTKARSLSIVELDQLLEDTLPLIMTNLTEKEITTLLLKVPLFIEKMDIEELTVPVPGTYGSMTGMGGRSLFAADFKTNAAILRELLYGSGDESGGE